MDQALILARAASYLNHPSAALCQHHSQLGFDTKIPPAWRILPALQVLDG